MRPDAGRVLEAVACNLGELLLPEVSSPFGMQATGVCIALLTALGQEVDRLVDRLLVESMETAAILRDAAPLLRDGNLRRRAVAAAGQVTPVNYRVATVQALNDSLRGLLIEVHAAVEQTPGEAAEVMESRIWSELQRSTECRQLNLAP
jgi:hypothetical protein